MSETAPDALHVIDRMANAADDYISLVIAEAVPDEPQRLRDAWHLVYTREVLRGNLLPVMVTWVHPQGWVCVELPGGPGPLSTVLTVPVGVPRLLTYLDHLRITAAPLYVRDDFFDLPPAGQDEHFVRVARLQQADDEAQPQEPTP